MVAQRNCQPDGNCAVLSSDQAQLKPPPLRDRTPNTRSVSFGNFFNIEALECGERFKSCEQNCTAFAEKVMQRCYQVLPPNGGVSESIFCGETSREGRTPSALMPPPHLSLERCSFNFFESRAELHIHPSLVGVGSDGDEETYSPHSQVRGALVEPTPVHCGKFRMDAQLWSCAKGKRVSSTVPGLRVALTYLEPLAVIHSLAHAVGVSEYSALLVAAQNAPDASVAVACGTTKYLTTSKDSPST